MNKAHSGTDVVNEFFRIKIDSICGGSLLHPPIFKKLLFMSAAVKSADIYVGNNVATCGVPCRFK
jgi:hypothetical protein